MLFARGLAAATLASCTLARHIPHKIESRQADQNLPNNICGLIVDAVNNGTQVFLASDAYACLLQVPFSQVVATRFIKYWKETLEFQSTIAYLKNPPQGYQQPAVDVMGQLDRIQGAIDAGSYRNEYDFEVDVQLIISAMHDGHVALNAGALSAFSFASPYEIASVSVDGKQDPKVYITQDLIDAPTQGFKPSAITTINGTETQAFLDKYAAINSWGYVETNAEWNSLMSHPTLDIQGGLTTFSGSSYFYPGDNLTFTFENGTKLETYWVAIYNELPYFTGPLTTGGDFYNYFVLGLIPDSYDPSQIPVSNTTVSNNTVAVETTPQNWYNVSYGAFPKNPATAEAELGSVFSTGVVSGYIYDDISIGVLSIPTFNIKPDSTGDFSQAVIDFVNNATEKNVKKVIIDLQRNYGGEILLAYTTFKAFFPDLVPFGGSRRRSFNKANALGSALSEYWVQLSENEQGQKIAKDARAADEWVINTRVNAATDRNFSSWQEYQGPVADNDDNFSVIERYDLSNEIFDEAAFDEWIPLGYLSNATKATAEDRAWQPEQIVLLTDGLCSSACTLFTEFMTRAGVRTIVAGGRPKKGPMQAAAGTRGAVSYAAADLDNDFYNARLIDDEVSTNVNATIPEVRESGIYYSYASFNLRDQIRQNEKAPLQFKYEAADCRIYYTFDNLYNMTRLWRDTAAAFADSSLCIPGSTGFSTTNTTNPASPPKPDSQQFLSLNGTASVRLVAFDTDPKPGLMAPKSRNVGDKQITLCPTSGVCQDPQTKCQSVNVSCSGEGTKTVNACLPICVSWQTGSCNGQCKVLQSTDNKVGLTTQNVQYTEPLNSGLCFPSIGTKALGCQKDPSPATPAA